MRKLNGVFSFTPDAKSILGEWPEMEGLWLAEAVWVTHGGGVGKLMAEWLVDGAPSYDVREVDIRRFAKHVYDHAYIRRRGIQQYREVYDIIHPLDQFTEPRGTCASRRSTPAQDALGAVLRGRRLGAAALVRGERAADRTNSTGAAARGRRATGRRSTARSTWPRARP